jgi:hypothetical protein
MKGGFVAPGKQIHSLESGRTECERYVIFLG